MYGRQRISGHQTSDKESPTADLATIIVAPAAGGGTDSWLLATTDVGILHSSPPRTGSVAHGHR